MALVTTEDSASISSTEYSLPADTTTGVPTSQSGGFILQAWVRIASIVAGDLFRVRFYRSINSGQVQMQEWFLDAQQPSWVMPSVLLGSTAGWDLTVTKISGTDRTVHWTLEKLGV